VICSEKWKKIIFNRKSKYTGEGCHTMLGVIKNHSMIDGNKRIGIHVMLVFLMMNGYELKYTQKELSETILKVAAGEKTYEVLLEWVLEYQL